MLQKKKRSCPVCDVEYKIIWEDEQEANPESCPFCGSASLEDEE